MNTAKPGTKPVVPFNDLRRETAEIRAALDAAAARVLDRGWFLMGEELKAFERAFAAYLGVTHCLGMANGTDALELALRCLGIGAGDRVVVAPNAGMYGTIAVSRVAAEPVFADIDPVSLCMSPQSLESVAAGAKAVIVTHLYGQMADIGGLKAVAARHRLRVIEDCAQAHGARHGKALAGSFGDLACFSFYPTKNLGALGDAGGIVTNDPALAETASLLRQYGWKGGKYRVEAQHGRNSRMDELQAAFLSVKLPQLDARNARRKAIWRRYREALSGRLTLVGRDDEGFVGHLCVLRSPHREALRRMLTERGIATDIHYPIPDHRQPVWRGRFDAISLPHAEQACAEVLTLPCFPEMTDQEVALVADALRSI